VPSSVKSGSGGLLMRDVRDMRDPQKLGEWMLAMKRKHGWSRLSHTYDDCKARTDALPVVAEADGVYVGPLQRYPRK